MYMHASTRLDRLSTVVMSFEHAFACWSWWQSETQRHYHACAEFLYINARPNIETHANEGNTKITSTDVSKTKHDPRLSNIFIPNETHSYRALETRPTDGPSLSSPSIQSSPVGFKNLPRKKKRKNRTRPFFFSNKGKGLSASTS
jgi:hypothetical protein